MINYSDIRKGVNIIVDGTPYQVAEHSLEVRGRGMSVMQVKLRNLKNGNIVSKTFRPSDSFEEPDLERVDLQFVYSARGKFVFAKPDKKRIELSEEVVGKNALYLKPGTELRGLLFEENIISIELPVKMLFKVTEAPPGIRAGRADAGTKQVTIETGAKINAPIFIEEGDTIEVNTQSDEYVRRVEKN